MPDDVASLCSLLLLLDDSGVLLAPVPGVAPAVTLLAASGAPAAFVPRSSAGSNGSHRVHNFARPVPARSSANMTGPAPKMTID